MRKEKKENYKGDFRLVMDSEDRISQIPDDLVHEILSSMEMTEVVRTSILSSKWRYLWARIPSLDFGTWRVETVDLSYAVKFINDTIRNYKAQKLQKFRIRFDFIHSKHSPNVDSWLKFAVDHDIEELDLSLLAPQCQEIRSSIPFELEQRFVYGYKIPALLFDCRTLVVLRLTFCELDLSKPLSLCSLKVLDLHRVGFDDLDISGCPLLEEVTLCECFYFGSYKITIPSRNFKYLKIHNSFQIETNIEIDAPYLSSIEISGFYCSSYNFKNPSSISKAVLPWRMFKAGTMDKLVENLLHVKSLTLSDMCMMGILYGAKELHKFLPLKTSTLEIEIINQVGFVLMTIFLKNCPTLSSLIININFEEIEDLVLINKPNYWRDTEAVFSSMSHLKFIKLNNCMASVLQPNASFPAGELNVVIDRLLSKCVDEINIAKLLLHSCKNLDELHICFAEEPGLQGLPFWSDMVQVFYEAILCSEKASSNARIYCTIGGK